MDKGRELGDFLQTRRSQMRPADAGLVAYGERRRVPGLRREELALLAGVSASYYSRLEQGQSTNASPEVLDAIAQALQLDDAERQHLRDLASRPRRRTGGRRSAAERVAPATIELLTSLGDVPALVLGWRGDVLAWNPMGHALLAGHLDVDSPGDPVRRPNMARMVFGDVHTRELYADWPEKARAVVGTLRLAAGRNPDDARLAALVGELTVNSTDFASMWADHRVKAGRSGVYDMRHPLIGTVRVTQHSLQLENHQSMVLATTETGSASHAAMTLLAHTLVKQHDFDTEMSRRSAR